MPTTRRRIARFQQDWITETHIAWLYGEPYSGEAEHNWLVYHDLERDDPSTIELDALEPPRSVPFLESAVTGRRLWVLYGEQIVEEHVREYPGTRPLRWWQFSAPEPRQRVGGIGTPRHECLAHVERCEFGVPDHWITGDDVRTHQFIGVPALDVADPPMYESEARYLERHELLLPGERRRLKPRDFKPENIIDILNLDPAEV